MPTMRNQTVAAEHGGGRAPRPAPRDERPAPRTSRRRWSFRIAATLMVLVIIFAIGELSIRLLLGSPLPERRPLLMIQANAHSGWRMMPRQLHYTYDYPVQVNSLGLRGPEVGDKRDGETRVLVLGDSLVYGQGVPDDQTLPAHLEAALRSTSNGASFTVVNSGHRGYSTNQQLGLLRELGPTIRPDVVVLCWFWNDLMEHRIDELHHRFTQSGPVVFDVKAKMEGGVLFKWRVRQVARNSALLMWLHDVHQSARSEPPSQAAAAQGLSRLGGYLDDMAAMSRQRGFTLMFAVLPDPNSLRRGHVSDTWAAGAANAAAKRGVTAIDLKPALRRIDNGRRLPVIPYDGHYNGEANAAMADALAEALRAIIADAPPRAAW